jgi:hypothetical protein
LHKAETKHGRYGFVLILILLTLTFELAFPEKGWAREIGITLQGVTLIAALVASKIGALQVRIVSCVIAGIVVASLFVLITTGDLGPTPAKVLGLLLAALAPAAIASGIYRHMGGEDGIITVQTMFGVLCIYLLIGLLFATGFGLIEAVGEPGFFSHGIVGDSSNFLYFSFATLTTVGYGDLTAATDLGRSLAITEALIGQIYLVTVVALIVANIGRGRQR